MKQSTLSPLDRKRRLRRVDAALYTLFIMMVVLTILLLCQIRTHLVDSNHEPVRAESHSLTAESPSSLLSICFFGGTI